MVGVGFITSLNHYYLDSYFAITTVGADSISVSWSSRDPLAQLQLQSVEVRVMSSAGCGGDQNFVFNVTSGMANSVTVPGLGMQFVTINC